MHHLETLLKASILKIPFYRLLPLPHPPPTMKTVIVLFLGVLVVALSRPIAQDDPDRDPSRTLFPRVTTTTTTTTTMMEPANTTKKEETGSTASASTSLSSVADAFEIAGSIVALLVFVAGAVVAFKRYREELQRNPGEIAQAVERLGNSIRVLLRRRLRR